MKDSTRFALLLAILLLPSALFADSFTINFDGLSDSDPVTTQFPSLTFSNATVLTAGISLNEFEFPPFSGSNVVFDAGGPIFIGFLNPIDSFGGYFTYSQALTLQAFDAGNNLLGSSTSLLGSNLALSGDPGSSPNEFLQLSFAGISSVRISGDSLGGSFTADNVTYTTPVAAVPEPSSIYLLLSGMGGLLLFRRKNL